MLPYCFRTPCQSQLFAFQYHKPAHTKKKTALFEAVLLLGKRDSVI